MKILKIDYRKEGMSFQGEDAKVSVLNRSNGYFNIATKGGKNIKILISLLGLQISVDSQGYHHWRILYTDIFKVMGAYS